MSAARSWTSVVRPDREAVEDKGRGSERRRTPAYSTQRPTAKGLCRTDTDIAVPVQQHAPGPASRPIAFCMEENLTGRAAGRSSP